MYRPQNKPIKRNWSRISLLLGLFAWLPVSHASETDYDELYSYRFEEMTGYELSEEGLRQALENFNSLDIYESRATIAVVGEQRYTSLIDRLKAIYSRTPADNPNPTDRANSGRYNNESFLMLLRVRIVRVLIRCGDPEAEEYAIEQAIKGSSMDSTADGVYAIRSLKYLVEEKGSDVLPELSLIIENHQHAKTMAWAGIAVREIIEIEHYLRETGSPKLDDCRQALDAIEDQAPSTLQYTIDLYRTAEPSWNSTRKIIEARKAQNPPR